MHPVQEKIIKLAENEDLSKLGYRKIGILVGVNHPQQIKHHITQLIKNGYISQDKTIRLVTTSRLINIGQPSFQPIPVYGSANCGVATLLAEDRIEGYIKVSESLLKKKDVIALRAVGNSLNKANIGGSYIEENDYVLVDTKNRRPKNGEYIVSIIDNEANIKKFKQISQDQIALISESTEYHPTIYISPEDNYVICGVVTQVIKAA